MSGFETIYERLKSLEVSGEIWVDGSFLTKKTEPNDIDFVVMVPSVIYDGGTPEQREFLDWLNNDDDPMCLLQCHSHTEVVYSEDSPFYHLTVASRYHWRENVFGYSLSEHIPKGIVVVGLPEPLSSTPVPTDNTKEPESAIP